MKRAAIRKCFYQRDQQRENLLTQLKAVQAELAFERLRVGKQANDLKALRARVRKLERHHD